MDRRCYDEIVTPELRQKVKELHLEGMTPGKISQHLQKHNTDLGSDTQKQRAYIHNLIFQMGYRPHAIWRTKQWSHAENDQRRPWSEEDKTRALHDYYAGLTSKEIAQRLGRTAAATDRVVQRHIRHLELKHSNAREGEQAQDLGRAPS